MELLEEYKQRFPLMHLKDLKKGTPTGDLSGSAPDETSVPVGKGMMPPEWARPEDLSRFQILYGDPFDTSVEQVFSAMQSLTAESAVAR